MLPRRLETDRPAAPLVQHRVPPGGVVPRDPLPPAEEPEPARLVEPHARLVLRKDGRLEGPDPGGLARDDQLLQQPRSQSGQSGDAVSNVACPPASPSS